MKSLLTLLQRVERLEDEVGVGPGSKGERAANESSDPFNGIYDDRYCLVEDVCRGRGSVEELVDELIG